MHINPMFSSEDNTSHTYKVLKKSIVIDPEHDGSNFNINFLKNKI